MYKIVSIGARNCKILLVQNKLPSPPNPLPVTSSQQPITSPSSASQRIPRRTLTTPCGPPPCSTNFAGLDPHDYRPIKKDNTQLYLGFLGGALLGALIGYLMTADGGQKKGNELDEKGKKKKSAKKKSE